MLKELDDYSWAEVFGEGGGGNCTALQPIKMVNGGPTTDTTFTREDVEFLRGQEEGENDGESWECWGKLKDGRWFWAAGWCDYTGWDCQAGNDSATADSEENLIRFGMTDKSRARFGIPQPV